MGWLLESRIKLAFRAGRCATSEPGFAVRFYRPGDEEGILRVLQSSFPRWPEVETDAAPIDHLRWKIANTSEPDTHLVAEVADEIIGCRLSLLRHVRCGSETRLARTDTDNAIVPEWRGRGVNRAIIRQAVETSPADVVITSSDEPVILRGDRALGHLPLRNRLSTMLCDLRAAGAPSLSHGIPISEVSRFDECIERFWPAAAAPFEFIAVPSADRLNWRYCDSRGGKGFALQAEANSEVIGFVAVRISRGQGQIAYLLALPERIDVISALVAESLVRLRANGVHLGACILPEHHPYRQPLMHMGFTGKGNRIPLTARPRIGEPALPFLRRHSPIHWMLGDTDLI